jgi:hypothetical protein
MNRFLRKLLRDIRAPRGPSRRGGRRVEVGKAHRPAVEQLEDRQLLALSILSGPTSAYGILDNFLQTQLTTIQHDLNVKVFNNPVPLLGSQLSSVNEGRLFTSLSAGLDNALAPEPDSASPAAVQQALFAALGPSGAGLLNSLGDIVVGTSSGGQVTTYQMVLHGQNNSGLPLPILGVLGSGTSFGASGGPTADPVHFDLALPGLPLSLQTQGSVDVSVDYGYALKFGINRQPNGSVVPFLDPSFTLPQTGTVAAIEGGASAPLAIHVGATINSSGMSGKLGLLHVSITDDPTHPSSFAGTYSVYPSVGPAGITGVTADLTGSANVNLKLAASFSASAPINPRLSTNFHLGWNFNGADTGTQPFGSAPTIQFNHVTLDLNSFVQSLQPILQDVQKVTGQLQPIVDFLNKPVPILSDVAGSKYTFGYVIDQVSKSGGVVETFANFINTINHLNVASAVGNIDLGSFTVSDARPGAGPAGKAAIATEYKASLPSIAALDQLKQAAGFDFPILDDAGQTFGLFLNKPADIVTV